MVRKKVISIRLKFCEMYQTTLLIYAAMGAGQNFSIKTKPGSGRGWPDPWDKTVISNSNSKGIRGRPADVNKASLPKSANAWTLAILLNWATIKIQNKFALNYFSRKFYFEIASSDDNDKSLKYSQGKYAQWIQYYYKRTNQKFSKLSFKIKQNVFSFLEKFKKVISTITTDQTNS